MKLLVYGINFAPELTGIGKYTGEMVAWLAAQGHEVRVVTAPPYYPDWKVRPGYHAGRYTRHEWQGAQVLRTPLWVPRKVTGAKRLLHLASFAAGSVPALLAQWHWKPDVVWVTEPPLFCTPAALAFAWLRSAKSWLHIQDYEMDAAFDLGLLKGARTRAFVAAAERWLMRRFDRISTISQRMLERARSKGTEDARLVSLPNWADVSAIQPLQGASPYRAELVKRCESLGNVRFLDLQPVERLGDFLGLADIHLLPQRADAADLVMPSKLTGMLSSGRPVVAGARPETELGKVMAECGIAVAPDDAKAFAEAVLALASQPERRRELGLKARAVAEARFDRDAVLAQFERDLLACVARR